MSLSSAYAAALDAMRTSLTALQHQSISIAAFCTAWRTHQDMLAELPPRYGQVLGDVLGRLEAGSLFTEESCSFSQKELHNSLAVWLDQATQTLSAEA